MVDVDQYFDMPSFLCQNVHPTILYTVQPSQVSRVAGDYSYTFNEEDELVYNITGGSRYKHRVWNYSTDHFVTYEHSWGFPIKVAAYYVDRKSTAPDHELIMLTPIGSWSWLGAILYCRMITGRTLSRLKVVFGSYTRLISSSAAGLEVSTGRPNAYASALIPVQVDDLIATVARTSHYALSLPQVSSFVPDRSAALPLLEYHRERTQTKPDVVCPVQEAVRVYQYKPSSYEPVVKCTLQPFMSPIIHGAFAPARTKANEEQCVQSRVLDVQPPKLRLTKLMAKAMQEFAEQLIPSPHLLTPTDHDEVYRRQNRPTQRSTFERALGMLPRRVIKMFIKSEAYPNIKPPRPISVVDPLDKLEYSRFMYAFEKVLKNQPWYAFSKSPIEIANRVTDILTDATTAANTDFSKFDGHGSNLMRDFERILLLRAFDTSCHAQLLELHRSQHNLKAYAALDTKYETKFSRASGSPETSILNTTVNAFVAFLAFRMSKRDGLEIEAEEAFERLGIYGGDDGLTPDIDAGIYTLAAKSIGQELTVEPISRGSPGIKFLARHYSPEVWNGDVNTTCDVLRQVAKFHTSVHMTVNVTPKMKYLEKIRCFSLSDLNTPIIGDLCQATIKITGALTHNALLAPISTWISRYPVESQYPNGKADWMLADVQQQIPEFEYKRFLVWCSSCTTVEQLMAPPMFMAPIPAKSDIPVIVDGDSLDVKHSVVAKPPDGGLPTTESKVCLTIGDDKDWLVELNDQLMRTQPQVPCSPPKGIATAKNVSNGKKNKNNKSKKNGNVLRSDNAVWRKPP